MGRRTVFVGITGGAGKTTTKGLLVGILSTQHDCAKSPGTGNEHREVEYAVLRTRPGHRFSVIELSGSAPGYLDRPLKAVRPFELDEAIATLAGAEGPSRRMQIETLEDGVTFVRDDFKAPQWSFHAPLEFMRDAQAQRKVVVIGTISDTPNEPSRRYAKAARDALEVADLVLLVGSHTLSAERANRIRNDGSLRLFASVRDASRFLASELRSGDLVLLKGTNKADHLVRILLDRRRAVQCWESSCRRTAFCDTCSRVYLPAEHGIDAQVAIPGAG